MLAHAFYDSLARCSDVAPHPYLPLLLNAVNAVDAKACARVQPLDAYANELIALIDKNPYFALDPKLVNQFAQKLGEAHFCSLCLDLGVTLERVPKADEETPDFRLPLESSRLYFEVKTFSVVGGDMGIEAGLESSFIAQLRIEDQFRRGKSIATAQSETQPYGDKSYRQGTIRLVITTLIDKISQNFKPGQFCKDNTFLVINLALIPPFRTENFVLRPAYCDKFMFPKVLTGELWMVAFAREGMLVHGIPEFEGKPCLEGILDTCGILVDERFSKIAGLLFMVHPWHHPSEMWGLFRSNDMAAWSENNACILDVLNTLIGKNWNNVQDTRGWELNGRIGVTPLDPT